MRAAESVHPLECDLRARFPSIALESKAEFRPAQQFVAGVAVSGMRVSDETAALQVLYPRCLPVSIAPGARSLRWIA